MKKSSVLDRSLRVFQGMRVPAAFLPIFATKEMFGAKERLE
jgi:hypothetical protein